MPYIDVAGLTVHRKEHGQPEAPLLLFIYGLYRPGRLHADTLAVAGELDLGTAPRLDRVLRWLELSGRPLALDLRDVHFVDCAGWAVVVEAMRRHREQGLPDVQLDDTSRQVHRFTALFATCSAGGPVPGSGRSA